jgi:hypothetical protein
MISLGVLITVLVLTAQAVLTLSSSPTAQPSFIADCSAGTYSVGGVCTLAPIGMFRTVFHSFMSPMHPCVSKKNKTKFIKPCHACRLLYQFNNGKYQLVLIVRF